ncbi:hypothetical protein RHSP_61624 [Rhizobium freirei PRF 81]|uniref:Uncharacterized protein n=1 Tax=Rhizobium freirei PRF 81 TaxID=363754 RepID=N6UG42_9HYPH|nr:hypothetical protein RHSP_61624 [Rhizobium freirei PRF 81]
MKSRKNVGCRLKFLETLRAPPLRFLIAAPVFDRPVLIEMGERPDFGERQLTGGESERQDRRARQGRDRMQAGEFHGRIIFAQGRSEGGDSLLRLLLMHHALGENEASADVVGRPFDHRVPASGLTLHQPLRAIGTIAEQIAAGEADDFVEHSPTFGCHAIDSSVHQTGYGHGRRIDDLGLSRPFGSHEFGERFGRQREGMARRGLDHLAVERDGMTNLILADRHILVEALGQRLLHLDLRTADRIGMAQTFGKIVQQVAHGVTSENVAQQIVRMMRNRIGAGGQKLFHGRITPGYADRGRTRCLRHLHVVDRVADDDGVMRVHAGFAAALRHHGRMRLRRAVVGGARNHEMGREAVDFKNMRQATTGFACHGAEQKLFAGCKRLDQRLDAVEERRLHIRLVPYAREDRFVMRGHGNRFVIDMRLALHPGDGDIEGETDDGFCGRNIRALVAEVNESPRHDFMDQPHAVDQRAVAIEKDQLHSSSGSPADASSKPRRFHVCTICGGRGAVTRRRPPLGCGISMWRACRCRRFWTPPGKSQFGSSSKYLGSPMIGWPICSAWTRSWCVRPVYGSISSQARLCAAVSSTR